MLVFLAFLVFSPIVFGIFVILLLILFKKITNPKLNKNWIELHKVLPEFDLRDQTGVFIKNVQKAIYNPVYEFEYKLEYLHKKFNLQDIKDVWFFEVNYAPMQSHIMVSFEFLGGKFLCISPEVRKANQQDFEVWHVLTKKFSIFYRIAVEEDLVYLRTNIRHSPVNMHLLDISDQQKKDLFLSIANRANNMLKEDLIYELFKSDCVNTLLKDFRAANIKVDKKFWDWSATRVLYRSGLIKEKHMSLSEAFKKSLINSKTAYLLPNENYSFKIRQ